MSNQITLSVRSRNIIKRLGAETAGEIARFTLDEILEARCFGVITMTEIERFLVSLGMRLGMTEREIKQHKNSNVPLLEPNSIPQCKEHSHEEQDEGDCCEDCKHNAEKLRQKVKA